MIASYLCEAAVAPTMLSPSVSWSAGGINMPAAGRRAAAGSIMHALLARVIVSCYLIIRDILFVGGAAVFLVAVVL
jgi:hypothetical protein